MDKMRKYFDAPNWKMLKTVVYKLETSGKYIGVALRGDLDINEIKLRKFIAKKFDDTLVLANEEDLEKLETVRGFISPLTKSNLDLECF
jgi:hypothetical protein